MASIGHPMTVNYNPYLRRSTHVESGLAVQWVRDEPPMERQTHFKLIADGREIGFTGYNDAGEEKIKRKYPGISALDLMDKINYINELNYTAFNVDADFDRDIFVYIWRNLVSQGLNIYRVSTYYIEYASSNPENKQEWSCEG